MDTKKIHGSLPKHQGATKDIIYHFRLTSFEKDILDSFMRQDQWRDFIILLSMAYYGLDEKPENRKTFDYAKRRENLFGVDIKGLLDSVKTKET